jgi:hypothetical protein
MRDCHEWASHISYSDKRTHYGLDCLLAKLVWQSSGAGSVITRHKTYADNPPVHLNSNQMAAKAATLPRMCHVGVLYSDTAIQYCNDILHCQIGLPNLHCMIYRNKTHAIWHMCSIHSCSCKWGNCARFTRLMSICSWGHRLLVHLMIANDEWFEAHRCIIFKIQLRLFILRLACLGTCNLASQLTSSLISH